MYSLYVQVLVLALYCQVMLALYRLPELPPTFGSSSASHSLLAAMRVVTTHHGEDVAKLTAKAFHNALNEAVPVAEVSRFSVPNVSTGCW